MHISLNHITYTMHYSRLYHIIGASLGGCWVCLHPRRLSRRRSFRAVTSLPCPYARFASFRAEGKQP